MCEEILKKKQKLYILRGEHIFVIKAFEDVDSSSFRYSIPLKYKDQIPIFLDLKGNFLSYELIKEKECHNRVIIFRIPKMKKDEEIKISLDYWTLAIKNEYKCAEYKNDIDLKKWTDSTESIKSDNILIKITSKILRGFTKKQLNFIHNVSIWNAFHRSFFTFIKRNLVDHPRLNKVFLSDVYWYRLEDSVSSLIFGSVCAGKANLQAAILRANGIPSRILISTSMFFGKDQWLDSQHYLVEAYTLDRGWIRVQSGQICTPSKDNIILRIVNPEEENIAGNGFSETGGAAPWFWFDNKNVFFGIPKGHMSYKIPKTKKVGFPATRGWREGYIEVPKEISEKMIKATDEAWELFFEISSRNNKDGDNFNKAKMLHKDSIENLKNNDFKSYIDTMKHVKELYLAL